MHLKKLEDTENLSQNISKIIKPGDVIFLYGEIGTGKTTFTRFLINYFERKNRIKNSEVLSPTFNIVYDYDVGKEKILHYDLYRLKNYKRRRYNFFIWRDWCRKNNFCSLFNKSSGS